MLVKIALATAGVLALLIVAFLAYVAAQPGDFRLVRERTLAAPPGVVFPYVDDLAKWSEWSPWEKLDPAMLKELSTPSSGVGATYHWVGNDKAGEGRMTITGVEPGKSVTIKLEFIKPFAAVNTTQFDLVPEGTGTKITWAMSGTNGFVGKAFHVLLNIDKLVGSDFEAGLAKLDEITSAAAKHSGATHATPEATAVETAPTAEPAVGAESTTK